ncbi:YcaO-like family protein [Kineococcus sp. NPDC059986]|uniref:YcaO-like family protein n=1 Tax=Kineococcus sp. NPDC059986 TaxID=3155538 RepID=UPI00344BEF34
MTTVAQEVLALSSAVRLRVHGLGEGTGVVVDDDTCVRTLTGVVTAQVATAFLARRSMTSADLLDGPGADVPVTELVAAVADLVAAGALVRRAPDRPGRVRVVAAGADLGLTEQLRGAVSPLTTTGGDVVVVVCEDHLDPVVADVLAAEGGPGVVVLPLRVGARRCWLGPALEAGSCLDCFAFRLRRNVVDARRGSGPTAAATVDAVAGILRAAALAAGGAEETVRARWRDRVLEVGLDDLTTVAHPASCRHTTPPTDPTAGPVDLLDRLPALVSALTGLLEEPVVVTTPAGTHLATAQHCVPAATDAVSGWTRVTAAGSGATARAAVTAAVGEAVERYSTGFHPGRPTRHCAGDELPVGQVLLPGDLFPGSGLPPFPLGVATDWIPLTRWRTGTAGTGPSPDADDQRWTPSAAVHFGHPDTTVREACAPDSNGCAVAPTLPRAVLAATLELVERDAVARWWWTRTRRPELPGGLAGAAAASLAGAGRRLHLLDLTGHAGIPVVVAVSADGAGRDAVLGFGAALGRGAAARRAVAEVGQALAAGVRRNAWADQPLTDLPWLLPLGERPGSLAEATRSTGGDDLGEVLARLGAAGVPVFVEDLTLAETGVPAVRVLAPGLLPWHRPADVPDGWDLPC